MLPLKRVLDAVSLVRLMLHIPIWYANPGRFLKNYPRLADPLKIKTHQILKNRIPQDRILSSFHKEMLTTSLPTKEGRVS